MIRERIHFEGMTRIDSFQFRLYDVARWPRRPVIPPECRRTVLAIPHTPRYDPTPKPNSTEGEEDIQTAASSYSVLRPVHLCTKEVRLNANQSRSPTCPVRRLFKQDFRLRAQFLQSC